MVKVITYGTYDLLHHGHIRLLERAKALGDYLIVGVTSDDFDKTRGKINVQQSLIERVEAVRSAGIADEIIVEEYEGQKINDIKRLGVDIFTVGSDWVGKFDYLKEYCKVVYLDRTEGVSSSEIREKKRQVRLGIVGDSTFINKIAQEATFVNGLLVNALLTNNFERLSNQIKNLPVVASDFDELLSNVDAVYIHSRPELHYEQIKTALKKGKHVICESPISLNSNQVAELYELADKVNCILQEAIKTAYATAYSRMLLLLKGGKIGKVVSVDSTCTSLNSSTDAKGWNSLYSWGPTAILPVLQILGAQYDSARIVSAFQNEDLKIDSFTKISFEYPNAVASIKVAKGVKSEGELIISGTKGYIYVPAPWWKTEYFEIRYENASDNKRYFYQLEGEGIRYELVAFCQAIQSGKQSRFIEKDVSVAIAGIMQNFNENNNTLKI